MEHCRECVLVTSWIIRNEEVRRILEVVETLVNGGRYGRAQQRGGLRESRRTWQGGVSRMVTDGLGTIETISWSRKPTLWESSICKRMVFILGLSKGWHFGYSSVITWWFTLQLDCARQYTPSQPYLLSSWKGMSFTWQKVWLRSRPGTPRSIPAGVWYPTFMAVPLTSFHGVVNNLCFQRNSLYCYEWNGIGSMLFYFSTHFTCLDLFRDQCFFCIFVVIFTSSLTYKYFDDP